MTDDEYDKLTLALKKSEHKNEAIPIFKLIKLMSLHDDNFDMNDAVPILPKPKDTEFYRKEMFPDETEE